MSELSKWLKKENLRLKDFIEDTGMDPKTATKINTGKLSNRITLGTLEKIHKAYPGRFPFLKVFPILKNFGS